jgi:hypothetical protein
VGVLVVVGALVGAVVAVLVLLAVAVGVGLEVAGVGVAQEPSNGIQRRALLSSIEMISVSDCVVATSIFG